MPTGGIVTTAPGPVPILATSETRLPRALVEWLLLQRVAR